MNVNEIFVRFYMDMRGFIVVCVAWRDAFHLGPVLHLFYICLDVL